MKEAYPHALSYNKAKPIIILRFIIRRHCTKCSQEQFLICRCLNGYVLRSLKSSLVKLLMPFSVESHSFSYCEKINLKNKERKKEKKNVRKKVKHL